MSKAFSGGIANCLGELVVWKLASLPSMGDDCTVDWVIGISRQPVTSPLLRALIVTGKRPFITPAEIRPPSERGAFVACGGPP